MSSRKEFEEIYSHLKEASGVELSEQDKEKLYDDYQTPKGRQDLLKLVAYLKEHPVEKKQPPKSFFIRLFEVLFALSVGWYSGVGVLFDGTKWWHHLAFIPIGIVLYIVLDFFLWADLLALILAKVVGSIKEFFGQNKDG